MTAATYEATQPQWRAYQRFFPARARFAADAGPVEERWAWRDADIHLDRYPCDEARLQVILVHGGGANGRLMAPVGVLLQKYGCASVAPDLPGYGLTTASPASVDYEAWLDLLSDLVDSEAARTGLPVVLVGVSLGGMAAYQVAARNPRVAGIVVTTLCDPSDPATREQLSRTWWLGRYGIPLVRAFGPVLDRVRIPIGWVSRMRAIANEPAIVDLLLSDRSAAGSRVPMRFLRTLMATEPAPPESFATCPVLLAHPAEDRMTPLPLSRRFFDRLTGDKQLVLLEGSGHMPLESPGIDQLEAAATAFLDRIARA